MAPGGGCKLPRHRRRSPRRLRATAPAARPSPPAGFVTPQVICSALNITTVQCKVRGSGLRAAACGSSIPRPPPAAVPSSVALRLPPPRVQVLVDLLAAVVEPADLVQRNEGEAGPRQPARLCSCKHPRACCSCAADGRGAPLRPARCSQAATRCWVWRCTAWRCTCWPTSTCGTRTRRMRRMCGPATSTPWARWSPAAPCA